MIKFSKLKDLWKSKLDAVKRVVKRMSKIDVIQSTIIVVLVIVIILSNAQAIAQFFGKLNPLAGYKNQIAELKQRNTILEFDRVRLEDASNILLSIQEFYFVNDVFPETLEELKAEGYLGPTSRLNDPATNQLYFYKKREQDFVLCVRLSDMLKGVNTTSCP